MNKNLVLSTLLFFSLLAINGCDAKKTIMNNIPGVNMTNYTWMSLYLPWRVETSIPGLNGWYSKPQKLPKVYLTQTTPYVAYITLGSNARRSYAVVRIDHRGKIVAAYRDSSTLRYLQKSFDLTPEQTKAFTQLLINNNAGGFDASYVDTKSEGGTQGGFTLATKGSRRRTFMSNAWPGNYRDICNYICDEILKFDPTMSNYGFAPVRRSIVQTDPEATLAVRGLIDN